MFGANWIVKAIAPILDPRKPFDCRSELLILPPTPPDSDIH
jgi:hypothetical protein